MNLFNFSFCSVYVFSLFFFFFFNDTATTEIYTLSLHDALPISSRCRRRAAPPRSSATPCRGRSEEHTSELQSRENLVCRLLLEKKKNNKKKQIQNKKQHRNKTKEKPK